MSIKNETIQTIKAGRQINGHECGDKWAKGNLKHDTPEDVFEFNRICRTCGKVVHVIQTKGECFDDVFQRFHGKE